MLARPSDRRTADAALNFVAISYVLKKNVRRKSVILINFYSGWLSIDFIIIICPPE